MCGSFFALLSNVIEVDGSRMARGSVYDQFVCRIWLTGVPVWGFLIMSTYEILITALERYIAVFYPVFYSVRINDYYAARRVSNMSESLKFWCRCIFFGPPFRPSNVHCGIENCTMLFLQ